ncbi:MAG: methionyl aminopeptidase [Anaerovoracaceae bacterium]|jgi:methionyl aminopeptidase
MAFRHKKIGRNDPCWCGSGIKYKNCHMRFDERIEKIRQAGHTVPGHELIKNEEQIAGIRESAKINIAVLDAVSREIHEGMSTEDIDKIVYEVTTAAGATPAPLNFEGFPKSVCTSINDEVCHGIPNPNAILHDGDIVNVDVSTVYKGYFSDSSRMFCIGSVSPELKKLVEVTRECVQIGIDHVIPWTFLGDMGDAIHQHALDNGYTVVEEFGGHGCGVEFHEDPFVSHVGKPGTEMLMVPGMTFTIEPMVNMGGHEIVMDADNGWTVYTEDGQPSAQWEVQVLVTEDGCEVLAY